MTPKPDTKLNREKEVLNKNEKAYLEKVSQENSNKPIKTDLIWSNLIIQVLIHIFSIWGIYLIFTSAKLATTIYGFVLYEMGVLGIMVGVHRLWSHRSYKVKWPLKIILVIFATIGAQKSIINWARDHRLHHKYSDTDADPHNAKRGFFYSHLGWQFYKKSPEVIEKGKGIDMSDLFADPILNFQHKHYWLLQFTSYLLPAFIPMIFWNETFFNAFCINWLRYEMTIHSVFSINSFSHIFGNKPFNKTIGPTENILVSILSHGEGWHNYHHTFPQDCRASEPGKWNPNFYFINLFAAIGWAYDLKFTPADVIKTKMLKKGDGSITY